ncbi:MULTISPECIES: DUF2909 domain-containing protein [Pseudoalteromonas]|uniref:DUF2909 domain-containing protein n=2 Tax=Pseudoalteromonas TaxID=53246 RepID=A0A5S3Z3Y6_9GAMM|nr:MULTISPECIES: DUF2909 domain-containing protein [Pseudoalteromonas]QFU06128.1 hypothetical protein FIU82_14135 [Pseudoalteromonas sp. THAF3]RZF80893.1 DUF2909 domain-containing protein [Pseudoalteromonas sp. CO325X]TLX52253.1 DUF2909 domain-containing protein [Pseudoalteromonas ruthenica]TMO44152.1 DUF2909 domain-containing protein [Pseudoalteromonas ruthenica]TMO53006.1 DUF2909 domain-containing protein [Pseudoalteromonas ruthenica]
MLIKIIIVALLLFVIYTLFRAMLAMLKSDSKVPMSHYLGKRVALCAIVLIIILLAQQAGLLRFNPSPITTHTQIRIDTTTPHQQSANTKPQPEMRSAFHC